MKAPKIRSKWRHLRYGVTAEVLSVTDWTATVKIAETGFTTRVQIIEGKLNGYEPIDAQEKKS